MDGCTVEGMATPAMNWEGHSSVVQGGATKGEDCTHARAHTVMVGEGSELVSATPKHGKAAKREAARPRRKPPPPKKKKTNYQTMAFTSPASDEVP